MEDLGTIYELGFATTNAVQAIGVTLVISLLINKYEHVWRYAGYALAVDRFVPILYVLAQSGAVSDASAEGMRLLTEIPVEIGALAIRYVCLMVVASFGYWARATLHARFA